MECSHPKKTLLRYDSFVIIYDLLLQYLQNKKTCQNSKPAWKILVEAVQFDWCVPQVFQKYIRDVPKVPDLSNILNSRECIKKTYVFNVFRKLSQPSTKPISTFIPFGWGGVTLILNNNPHFLLQIIISRC